MGILYNYMRIEEKWDEDPTHEGEGVKDWLSSRAMAFQACYEIYTDLNPNHSDTAAYYADPAHVHGKMTLTPDIPEDYGWDAVQVWELFTAPPQRDGEWDDEGMDGIYRFLSRICTLSDRCLNFETAASDEVVSAMSAQANELTADVTKYLDTGRLNVALSCIMKVSEQWRRATEGGIKMPAFCMGRLLVLLMPMAPLLSSEMLEMIGYVEPAEGWPSVASAPDSAREVRVPVEVGGKVRTHVMLAADADRETAVSLASEAAERWISVAEVVRIVYVPGKVVSFGLAREEKN